MKHKHKRTLENISTFDTFRDIVVENIGYFPNFHYDEGGLAGHRMRVFRNPPSADIRYSERALARYIAIADIIFTGINQHKPEPITSGLCLLSGGELLRQNKFIGFAFIATAFLDYNFVQIPPRQVVDIAIKETEGQGAWHAVINLLFPLAHEIGHLPESQNLCPAAIYSDAIYETYSTNFNQVRRFTGDFDYKSSLQNPRSPLNLTTLRQEAASDFFAVAAMTSLALKSTTPGEQYPLSEVVAGIFTFPLVMGIEAIIQRWGLDKRAVQDITLAMHCRYSLIIDSVRGGLKFPFRGRTNAGEIERYIDSEVDQFVNKYDNFYVLLWNAFLEYLQLSHQFAKYTDNEVINLLRKAKMQPHKSAAIAKHIEMLADDVHGYPINSDNHTKLREYSQAMKTFDRIILLGKNALS